MEHVMDELYRSVCRSGWFNASQVERNITSLLNYTISHIPKTTAKQVRNEVKITPGACLVLFEK